MYKEDDLLPISALQHLAFCPRQCALIHIEQAWDENVFTAEGRVMHEKAHDADSVEHRDGVRIDRGMALRSLRLGLIGKADVVEFHRVPGEKRWQPFPVEYKRGKPKTNNCDKIQLCSQAICLEEMLGIAVPAGALYYGKTRHRLDVIFDESLRRETGEAATRLHVFIREGRTPFPIAMPQCDSCSLVDICMPKAVFRNNKVGEYVKKMMEMG